MVVYSDDPDAPGPVSYSSPIMSVTKFTKGIEDIRLSSNGKIVPGPLMPIVLVVKDTAFQIEQKKAKLKKKNILRLISSSEDEEYDADDPQPQVSSPTKPLSPAHLSDLPDNDGYMSEYDTLPDISDEETKDPTYDYNRRHSPAKVKSPKGCPKNRVEKVKKKAVKPYNLHKGGDGKLMKAAKMTFLSKQKMLQAPKDKRISKTLTDSDKSSMPSQIRPPSQAFQPCRTTGIVELKPNAKSPRDVERNSGATDWQEKMRLVLQSRLDSPPPSQTGKNHEAEDNSSPESHKSSGDVRLSQDSNSQGYNSDDTVPYDEEISSRLEDISPDVPCNPPITSKRKKNSDRGDAKHLKTGNEFDRKCQISSQKPGLDVVPSPEPFTERSSRKNSHEGEQNIKIQQVEGGVTGVFESPKHSSTNNASDKMRLLNEKAEEKRKEKATIEQYLSKRKEVHEENLRKKKEEYEKWVKQEKRKYEKEVCLMEAKKEALLEEINVIYRKLAAGIDAVFGNYRAHECNTDSETTKLDSAVTVFLNEDDDDPEQNSTSNPGLNEGLGSRINVIPEASITKFGPQHDMQTTQSRKNVPVPVKPVITIKEPNMHKKRGRPKKEKPVAKLNDPSSARPNATAVLQPTYSVAPVTHQSSPNVIVSKDGTIQSSHRPEIYGNPPPPYTTLPPPPYSSKPPPYSASKPHLFITQPKTQPLPNMASVVPSPVLGQSTFPNVQLSPSPQFHPQTSTSTVLLSSQFPNQNSQLVVLPQSTGIPTLAPVLVQTINPVISDSQRLPVSNAAQFSGVSQPSTFVTGSPRINIGGASKPVQSQPQKSHLMVAPQPSAVTSGSATQAKPQPSNTALKAAEASKSMGLQKTNSFTEEESSSPEAELTCFVCGDPGGYKCCSKIVYCSEDCKIGDSARHTGESGECAHKSSK